MFTQLKLTLGHWLTSLSRKLDNNFYIYLAVLLSILVLLDASIFHVGLNMRDKAFDFMVKNRVLNSKPDADIVIVDINETSLATLAKDYGRWPWPRQVLGEFVENIESQKPKAIVFDIVFSDADIYNPDSDAYFNAVIAANTNIFFPILRLDASADVNSQLKYTQIPGAVADATAKQHATIAAILPYFDAALKPNRLGTHNVYPDIDGIVREYPMYHLTNGWRLPSLPELIGHYAQPNATQLPQNMLINWRGKPFSYQYVTFSDVYLDLASQIKKRPANEFTNKIVIIGSTAAGLFDIKATAMDKQFPGVEILATAIDNVKHHDYLKVWRGKVPYLLLSLLLIWATALAFYTGIDRDRFNSIFTSSQIGLLIFSYISINLGNTYLDLTAPILWAVACFGIAKIYALATDRAVQNWLAFGVSEKSENMAVIIMPILFEKIEPLSDNQIKKLNRLIALKSKTPCNIEAVKGIQNGLWGLFGDMLVITWTVSEKNPAYLASAKQDVENVKNALQPIIVASSLPNDTSMRYTVHESHIQQNMGKVDATLNLASQWRTIFAEAVLKLEQQYLQNTVKENP
jgi:adenylate cyclase